jgi:ligand-binding sensor domain-containing protein
MRTLAPIFVGLITIFAPIARSQQPLYFSQWFRVDHWGDNFAFLIKGGDILTLGNGYLYRYSWADSLWQKSPAAETEFVGWKLIAGPRGDLFAGTRGNGVWRTTNDGLTWTNSTFGMTDLYVNALAVDTNETVYAATQSQIFVSKDSGKTWLASNLGFVTNWINSLFVCPDGTIIGNARDTSVFLSENGGESWVTSNTEFPNAAIVFATGPDSMIYAGAWPADANINSPQTSGIYSSTNSGKDWTSLGFNHPVDAIAVSSPGTIYAHTDTGLFRSTDLGKSWVFLNSPPIPVVTNLAIDSIGTVFVGGWSMPLYCSYDSGETWTQVFSRVTNSKVISLTIDNSGVLFAGTEKNGVFVTSDRGNSWTSALNGQTVTALATIYDGKDSSIALAGTQGSGILRSMDNGSVWSASGIGLTDSVITSIAADSEGMLFAGTLSNGVFVSSDNGLTWAVSNTGLTSLKINCLASSPLVNGSSDLYAATDSGIFLLSNHGSSWVAVNSGLTNQRVLSLTFAANGNSSYYVFAGIASGGVFRSSNRGLSWSSIELGPGGLSITSMASIYGSSFLPTFVAAGSDTGGFFCSLTADGSSWQPYNGGLPNKSIHAVAADYKYADEIYVGTDEGIFAFVAGGPTRAEAKPASIPNGFRLEQNYPNPFNPSTTIRFSVPAKSRVRLTVYNLLGQQVAELANEEMSAGNFERTWNANVASGLYFYRIEAVSVTDPSKRFIDVKKMVVVK